MTALNETTLQRLAQDVGPEMMPLILGKFAEELSSKAEALSVALAAGDLGALSAHAHSLKSTTRTLGLDAAADVAAKTELAALQEARETAVAGAEELMRLCASGQQLVEQALERF